MATPPEILRRSAELIRGGQIAEARILLAGLLKQDPDNDSAWYLLSFAAPDKNQQLECLKRAARLNPANNAARARLEKLEAAARAAATPPSMVSTPPQALPPTPPAVSAAPHRTIPPIQRTETSEASDLRAELGMKPAGKPSREAAPRQAAAPASALVPTGKRKPAGRRTARKRISPWIWATPILIVLCLGVVIGGFFLYQQFGQQLFQQAGPLPTAVVTTVPSDTPAALPTLTPKPTIGLAPTWTPTPLPSITPTPTITPSPIPSQTPTLAPPGPTAMSEMLRLEEQVIELRGLEPLHEVPRYVTTRPRFLEALNAEVYTTERLTKMQAEEWTLKAMGMISPTFSMSEYAINSSMTGVSGVYVPWKKEIYVFGLRFSGVEAFVYVHEFDHALVDQHHDFDTKLGTYPDCRWNTQRCDAISALVEGDATLLMYLWWQQYASYETWRDFWYYVPPSALPSGQEPPPFLTPQSLFPYDYGFEFVNKLYESGGWSAVNRAYDNLPTSTEQILHPEKYFAGENPLPVNDPRLDETLGSGWMLAAEDSLGEWMTYLLLGYGFETRAQLGDEDAKSAAAGWGGDHYQTAHNLQTGQTVVSAHWVWDTQAAADEFNQAFATYNSRRFDAATINLGRGQCWQADGWVSCTLTSGRETLWLVTPEVALMEKVLAAYPEFR